MLPDYYLILGLRYDASQLEIKAAYRNLAKLHHPDKHGGAPEKERLFKKINEAHSVLSHIDTKFAYDKQLLWQKTHHIPDPPSPATTTNRPYRPPPTYRPPAQPYQYAPRQRYDNVKYVYSKFTLMYGKIFVIGLIMFVILFPILLEYNFSNYFYKKGLEALENHDYENADNFFHDAMRDLGGSNTLAAIKNAELKLAFSKNREAMININAGMNYSIKTANKARLYYLKGLALQNLSQWQQADTAFTIALTLHYNPDSIYTQLAPLYAYKTRRYDQAINAYNYLIQRNPENPELHLHRGFCYQKLEKYPTSLGDFNFFIKNKGENGLVLFLKGISQISIGEADSACANFLRSEELGVRNARLYYNIYCKKEDKETIYPTNPF